MQHNCPACGELLRGKLLRSQSLPGTFRLSNRATLACPACASRLMVRMHPAEIALALLCIAWYLSYKMLPWWGAIAAGIGIGLIWLGLHWRYLRQWPRYGLYEGADR